MHLHAVGVAVLVVAVVAVAAVAAVVAAFPFSGSTAVEV